MSKRHLSWRWREFGLAWFGISLVVSLAIWSIIHDIDFVILFLGLFSIIVFLMAWRAEAERMKAAASERQER